MEATNVGILCVTRDNMNAPWLLFEAGALAKSIQSGRVVPLLLDLDLRDITGPLAQFQAKKADEAGITDLVTSLNKLAEKPLPESRIEKTLTKFLGELCETIRSIPPGVSASAAKHTRDNDEVLEELLTLVRGIDGHIKGAVRPSQAPSKEMEECDDWRLIRGDRDHEKEEIKKLLRENWKVFASKLVKD